MTNTGNLDNVNSIIEVLSKDLADYEAKNEELKKKIKELEKDAQLLTSEIQNKAIEISNLKKENVNLIKTNSENKKEIDELRLFRKIHEQQNYENMLNEKNRIEKEKEELEKQYLEMKNNFENEHKRYEDLDQRFYQYKKQYELNKSIESETISKLEIEAKENKEELTNKNKIIEENSIKLKEFSDIIKNLQKEKEKIKSEMEELKTESYKKVEDMRIKMEKASQNVFSPDKILNIVAENIHILFAQEYSLSLNKIIEEILKNFIKYSESLFIVNESGKKNIHNDENIYLYNLKDIYFYIYFYVFNLKKNKQEADIAISNKDFTDEVINNLTNEIYKNNIIHLTNEDSQILINNYMNNLKKLGVDDEHLSAIKDNYIKKNENFKIYLLNIIKSLIKKCSDTIRNSTIEMNNKILYDFRNYKGEEYTISKNNLQINCDKIDNNCIDGLLNIIKYSPEKITRIHFKNSFNRELSEYNIEKIFLYIMIYNNDLLSLSISDCENINNNIILNIIFAIQNLKKIRILNFESCNLDDNHIKIITEGIKDNKSIIALLLRKNNISSQGAFYISDYLNNNMNIRQLFLGDNNIKDDGLKSLLNILSTNNKNITNLDLSYNNFKLNDFNYLIDYLKTNPILNSLDISGNKLALKSIINLGAIICNLKNIKSINMSNMGINSENIPHLLKNYNLDEIVLDDNNLEEVGLIMLTKGLEGNKNLKIISLKNTKLSYIGLTSLLKMLTRLKDFKELHLENNAIDDNCINIIKTTLKTQQFKIFVSKNLISQEMFKDETIEKESNLIMI